MCQKKHKAVILLSTYHHENKIIENEKNQKKPEIILDYNKNKGKFIIFLIQYYLINKNI